MVLLRPIHGSDDRGISATGVTTPDLRAVFPIGERLNLDNILSHTKHLKAPSLLSIVIPTLNAASSLGQTIDAVNAGTADFPCEVIVADGGSADDTHFVAADRGAVFVATRRGRGWQLGEGAKAAAGDWFLFLHADTVLGEGWVQAVAAFMNEPSNRQRAGYFRFALDDEASGARWLEHVVAYRSGFMGLPYGDQGLLISRAFYEELGGFKPMPLMEDVEIVRRISRNRLDALGAVAVTSAERYRRDGYLRRSLRNMMCLGLYSVGVPPKYIDPLYR